MWKQTVVSRLDASGHADAHKTTGELKVLLAWHGGVRGKSRAARVERATAPLPLPGAQPMIELVSYFYVCLHAGIGQHTVAIEPIRSREFECPRRLRLSTR